MASISEVPRSCDVSPLFDKFAKICPRRSMTHFVGLRTILENSERTIQMPWEIYPIYNNAMKIARILTESENPKLKSRFINILEAFNNKIVHQDAAPDRVLEFTPILDVIRQDRSKFFYKEKVVNGKDDQQLVEAAIALDLLTQEGIGISPGIPFLTTRLKSPNAWCIIVKNKQKNIIASVLGTNLSLAGNGSKVFHFNILVRSPKYPLIDSIAIVEDHIDDLTEQFHPDFLSLCVDIDNPIRKKYEKCGFVQVSVEYNPTIKRDAAFMVKCVNRDKQELPLYADVRAALTLFRQQEQS